MAIIRAEGVEAEEEAVKQILRNRGVDVDKMDVTMSPRGDTIQDEAGLALEAHGDAVNRAVDEAMGVVRDVKENLMPQLELAEAAPTAPKAAPAAAEAKQPPSEAVAKPIRAYRGNVEKRGLKVQV
ncbi:MAG: hypothetical protein ACYSUV_19680, partial [Planctomycetota bacterium]